MSVFKKINFGLFITLLITLLVFPLQDGDTFFYLAIGRYFFEHGSFPEADIYSYVSKNWHILHEWLSYLIFYAVYLVGNYVGLILFKTAIWAGIFFTFLKYVTKFKLNLIFSYLILLLTVIACSHRFTERASLFSEVFFVLIFYWFVNANNFLSKKLYFLPLIFLAWVNMHPGYILGLFIITLFLIFDLFECFWQRKSARRRPKIFIFSYILCFIALLINPYFINGVLYPIKTVLKPSWDLYKSFNYEWMPTFNSPFVETFEVRVLCVLILVSFFLLFRNFKIYKNKFVLYLALHVGLIILISQASRFMTTGSLGLCILSLKYLKDKNIENLQLFTLKTNFESVFLVLFGICQISAIVYILNFGYISTAGPRKFEFGIDSEIFPVEAVNFIQNHQIQGKIFNEYEWGGYLIWKLNRADSIFIHGHIDDPNLLAHDYQAINSPANKFDQTIQKYGIKYFLLDRIKLLRPGAENLLNHLEKNKLIFSNASSILVEVN